MSAMAYFTHPWLLLLLPLALLPFARRRDVVGFPDLGWLPADRAGDLVAIAWRAAAAIAIVATVIALAGPGRPETEVTRTGRGAEVVMLIDRSRSMDDRMLMDNWRDFDPLNLRHHVWSDGPVKSQVARDLLSRFARERPEDRFAVMFFSGNPMEVVPFTQHGEVVQAGITAGGVGRGLSDTNVGHALEAAIATFDKRAYSGSRIILLVSDGGAQLDAPTRRRIVDGLTRNRVALYFLYLRSYNGKTLDAEGAEAEAVPEIALHRFFQTLSTPYHAYQSEVPGDFAKAVADVARQQNYPLDYQERIPRRDDSRPWIALAVFACGVLLLIDALTLRRFGGAASVASTATPEIAR